MSDFAQVAVAILALAVLGFIVFKVTRSSGSSTTTGGYTRPGKPNRDTDLR